MQRALLCPDPVAPAAFLRFDARDVAPLRARLRQCQTAFPEHMLLRHREAVLGTCRACREAIETVEHVFLECSSFSDARREADDRLAAMSCAMRCDLPLNMSAIAGVVPAVLDDDARLAFFRATAGLLLAVRASPDFGHLLLPRPTARAVR